MYFELLRVLCNSVPRGSALSSARNSTEFWSKCRFGWEIFVVFILHLKSAVEGVFFSVSCVRAKRVRRECRGFVLPTRATHQATAAARLSSVHAADAQRGLDF